MRRSRRRRSGQTLCSSSSRSCFCRQGDPARSVGGGSDSDERGWDVVHHYVGGLPDNAAACLGVGDSGCGWGEDAQGMFLLGGRWKSVGRCEVLVE